MNIRPLLSQRKALCAVLLLAWLVLFTQDIRAKCEFNRSAPADNAFFVAMAAAIPVVIGSDTEIFCAELYQWKKDISQSPYNMGAEYQEGLRYTDAVRFLKIWLSLPDYDNILNSRHVAVVTYAFRAVYGHEPSLNEIAKWGEQIGYQKAWYAVIVGAEIKKLHASND